MRSEANPLIEHLHMEQVEGYFAPLPCLLYRWNQEDSAKGGAAIDVAEGTEVYAVVNGVQHERDLIGCEAAAITTQVAIQRLQPDIVISSGTCGGWQRYGGIVGQPYIANGVMFHDRRVPGDNLWDTQGLGNYAVWEGSQQIAEALGLPMGKVTTGSSFDLSAEEDKTIDDNGGTLKEMEGAAVAFVCSLYSIPVMLVKAITNLRDSTEEEDIDAFQRNLKMASANLKEVNIKIIEQISHK